MVSRNRLRREWKNSNEGSVNNKKESFFLREIKKEEDLFLTVYLKFHGKTSAQSGFSLLVIPTAM